MKWKDAQKKKILKTLSLFIQKLLGGNSRSIVDSGSDSESYVTLRLGDEELVPFSLPDGCGSSSFVRNQYQDIQPWCESDDPDNPVAIVAAPVAHVLSDAVLIGRRGLVFKRWSFISESIGSASDLALRGAVERSLSRVVREKTPVTRRYDKAFSVVFDGAWNYYHWVMECLPRMFIFEEYVKRQGVAEDIRLLLPPDPHPWMIETFAAIGYEWNSEYELTSLFTHVNELILPGFRRCRPSPFLSTRDLMKLRERVFDYYGLNGELNQPSGRRRLYISRELSAVRRCVNEAGVQTVLQKFGFEIVFPEKMDFHEQVKMFRDCEIVVGPHGAGFTNLLFSDHCRVLEFMGREFRAVYHALCTNLGHDYNMLHCVESAGDIDVDLEQLEREVGRLVVQSDETHLKPIECGAS